MKLSVKKLRNQCMKWPKKVWVGTDPSLIHRLKRGDIIWSALYNSLWQ
ncbi:MAG TPA: hypothetical protein VGB04_12475 [Allosphingosinicella sp.]